MGIEYSTNPKTFEELCDSVRGQVERSHELKMMGQKMKYEEMVEMTSESFMSTLERIEQLSEMAMANTNLFVQINDIFQWIFKFIGFDIENLDSEDYESGLEDEGEEN